nr:MAG TPA: hypothetical protein [Caudoviricetes sp.]
MVFIFAGLLIIYGCIRVLEFGVSSILHGVVQIFGKKDTKKDGEA